MMADAVLEQGASIAPIYERLSGAGNYHPFTAETFADWSLQAGDVVALQKGGANYEAPVYASHMTWHGKTPQITLETTGNQEREAVSKLGARKYSGGGGGYRNTDEINTKITQNEEMILMEAWNRKEGFSSMILQTASMIRAEVSDAENGLRTMIMQTASGIRAELEDARNDLTSMIEATASHLRAEFNDGLNGLSSSVEITASQLRAEFNDSINGVYSSITETASSIRAEVHSSNSALYSFIEETDSHIRSEVGDAINGVYSSITETASQIRAEVHNAESSLYSAITTTATQIRAEVADTTNSLHSAIEVNADNIALKVSKGDVSTQLAVEAGNVTISGGNLVVDGYVTANQLQSEIADLESAWADVIVTEEVSANTILADVGVYTPLLSVSGTSYTGHTISITNVSSGTYLGTQDLTLDHYHAITATESNGVITVEIGAAQSTAGTDSFNIADTQFYQDAVASARQAGVQSVTINQSGIMIDPDDYAQYDSTNIRYRVPVYAEISNGHGVTKDIYISAQAAYNAGAASASQRSASSLSNLTLFASHTGTASRNVKVTYDTGDYVSLPIQIDASAVYAAGRSSVTIARSDIETDGNLSWSGSGATYPGTPSSFNVTVPVKATASNGNYNTNSLTYNAAGFWENGRAYGAAQAVCKNVVVQDGGTPSWNSSTRVVTVPVTSQANVSGYSVNKTLEVSLSSIFSYYNGYFLGYKKLYEWNTRDETWDDVGTGYWCRMTSSPGVSAQNNFTVYKA